MTSASIFVLSGVLGLLITGILAYRLESNALGKLWTLLAVAGVLLFAWGRMRGGYEGIYALALLLVFVLPVFVGTLIAGLIGAWRDRNHQDAHVDPAPETRSDVAEGSSGDRGIDLLLRRMRS